MIKPTTLYSSGLTPFAYSIKENTHWVPAGEFITYKKTNDSDNFTLRWKYTYKSGYNEVYFAQFIPYTYSDLLKYLKSIKSIPENNSIVRIDRKSVV